MTLNGNVTNASGAFVAEGNINATDKNLAKAVLMVSLA